MIPIPFEYETLRLIWWVLLGILLIGFAIMDGFDMGVAFLNPIIGRTDAERRIILNTVGPVWDGNQVWLLLAGGAIFAAFPAIYAAAFSGFYIPMLLVLLSLIMRPVSFEFRNKFDISKRKYWDYSLFLSGLIPPLVFGVAFGNLFQGVPFFLDELRQPHYVTGSGILGILGGFPTLLNPFGLLCGLVSVLMLIVHGAVFLACKTKGIVHDRAVKVIYITIIIWFILFLLGGLWIGKIEGFKIVGSIDHNGPSNPMIKEVTRIVGSWSENYVNYPMLIFVPLIAFICSGVTAFLTCWKWHSSAFIFSGLMIASVIATAGIALFPFLLPSSIKPNHSLTLWDATSSSITLWLMTIAALIFIPIIIIYTSWAYRVMRGTITEKYVKENTTTLY